MTQSADHMNLYKHQIVYQDRFADITRFIQLARDNDKLNINSDLTITLITPPTVPPSAQEIDMNAARPINVGDVMKGSLDKKELVRDKFDD